MKIIEFAIPPIIMIAIMIAGYFLINFIGLQGAYFFIVVIIAIVGGAIYRVLRWRQRS